jgi:two-component system alkaline phosphatase synthesis response regulator PhoP
MEAPLKILIADDEADILEIISFHLIKAGFEVITAKDGSEAIEKANQFAPDCIILDIMMPKRDGFSVLESIKKDGKGIPVFVMSNLGQQEDIAHVKSLGAKDYIIKADTSPAEITQKVADFLK